MKYQIIQSQNTDTRSGLSHGGWFTPETPLKKSPLNPQSPLVFKRITPVGKGVFLSIYGRQISNLRFSGGSFESHRNFKTDIFVTFWLPFSHINAQIVLFSDFFYVFKQTTRIFTKKHPFTPKFQRKSPYSPLSPLHPWLNLAKLWGWKKHPKTPRHPRFLDQIPPT